MKLGSTQQLRIANSLSDESFLMDPNNFSRSQKLQDVAQRFRQSTSVTPLSHNLTKPEPYQSESFKRPNRSAVLICLFEEGAEIYVILTKRSSKLSSYSGHVSLPGGRTDERDTDDIQTALREAEEEIGLDPTLVDVVTVLEPFITKESVTVVPVLGILWNMQAFNPVPNVEEVESIFYAPLEMFFKNENRRQEERELPGDKYVLHYFDFETDNRVYVIWALTAGILISTASLVYQRAPDFEPRMPKFWKRNHSRF